MAKLIPNTIPKDTLSEGEKQIFSKLKNEPLTKDWIVLHSLDIAKHGWRFKGEADFVALIPNYGVMVIEVKACKYLKDIGRKLDVNELPLNDFKTFDLLKKGDTTGVFQLEGQGMKETLKKVLPDRFEDIIAVVSLYRPANG